MKWQLIYTQKLDSATLSSCCRFDFHWCFHLSEKSLEREQNEATELLPDATREELVHVLLMQKIQQQLSAIITQWFFFIVFISKREYRNDWAVTVLLTEPAGSVLAYLGASCGPLESSKRAEMEDLDGQSYSRRACGVCASPWTTTSYIMVWKWSDRRSGGGFHRGSGGR